MTKDRTRKRADRTWYGLQECIWNVFAQADCLQQSEKDRDAGKPAYTADEKLCVLTSLFVQRASRKTREFFRIYAENPDLTVSESFDPIALRQAMKLQRKTKFPRHKAPIM